MMWDFLHPYKSKCVLLSTLTVAVGASFLVPPAAYGQGTTGTTSSYAARTERELTTVAGLGPHNTTGPYEGFPGLAVPLGGLMGSVASADGKYLYFSDALANKVMRLDLVLGTVTTYAGSGVSGKTGDGQQATQAKLNYPRGLALDTAGNLYIADYNNHTVRCVDTSGVITTVAGNAGFPDDQNGVQGSHLLYLPVSLLWTSNGTLLIGEEGNGDVRSYNVALHQLSPYINLGTPGTPSGFKPLGLAEGPNGIFVSDYTNYKIFLFDGTKLTTYAGTGSRGSGGDGGAKESATFTYIEGLAYDAAHGTLSIADMGNGFVRQIAVTSAAEFTVGTIRTVAGAIGGNQVVPAVKVPATKFAAGMGGLPSQIYGLTVVGDDLYIVGGIAPDVFTSGEGLGSVVRLSREDGYVIPRFYAQTFSGYLSFELPANTTWSSVELGGSSGLRFATVQDCDLGSSYTTKKLCRPVVQVDSTAGPANGYVRVGTTGPTGGTVYRDFGIVAESNKNSGVVIPQAAGVQDLMAATSSTGAKVSYPSSVTLNLAGKPVITDSASNQVYVLNNTTLTLLAGSAAGTPGYSGDNGAPTSALLNAPSAVVHAPSNLYYIADAGNHVVRVVDPLANTIRTVAGNGTAGPPTVGTGTFSNLGTPSALAVRRDGTLLIADSANNMVLRFDPRTGLLTVVAGNGTAAHSGDGAKATDASLNVPGALAVGPNDEIYIAELGGHDIRVIDPKSGFISTYAGSATGQAGSSGDFGAPLAALLNTPNGLSVDPSGGLVVADSGNQRTRYVTHPSTSGTQTAKVLPYLAATLPGLRSASSGVVLAGTSLLYPTGGGTLSFNTPGSQLFTLLDTGARQPDSYVSYTNGSLNTGSQAFSLSSSASGTTYPFCTAVNSGSGVLTGEACQWGVTFQPSDTKPYTGSGTFGISAYYSLVLPFTLNGGTAAPLVFNVNHLTEAYLNVQYSATAGTLSGGSSPYGPAQVTAGALPAGVALSVSGSDVILSGKPTESGTFNFTITVTDAGGTQTSQQSSLIVKDAVKIEFAEVVHMGDSVTATQPLTISATEVVHVSDTTVTTAAIMISDVETIHAGDSVVGALGIPVSVNEAIHVGDTTVVLPGKKTQTITAAAISNQTYGPQTITLSYSASSNLPVSVQVTSGPASLSGNTLTLTGAGTVKLTYTQAGDANYEAAQAVVQSFDVARATATITASSFSRKYGQPNIFGSGVSGVVHSSDVNEWTGGPSLSTTATQNSPAGIYPIHITIGSLASKNYNFQFVDGTMTVTGGVAQTITFLPLANFHFSVGGITLTAHSSSGLKVTYKVTGPATVSGNQLHFTGVGAVSVTAVQSGNATFSAAAEVTRSFQVLP